MFTAYCCTIRRKRILTFLSTTLSLSICANLIPCTPAYAAELKVDINESGRQLSETLDPAYTPWSSTVNWFAGGNTISSTFDGVTIIFTRVGPEGTGLKVDWYKAGIDDATHNSKLVNDGLTVDPHNLQGNGGQIEMRIRGLTAGPHTLLAYVNTWQNPASYSFSPLNISVDGVQVITNLPVSNRVLNNADAATAYLELNAQDGQDVVVLFQADTNNTATDKNVCIDGFEIDTPNSSLKAVKPVPADRDEHADADSHELLLSWTPAGSAVSHDVYFGTDSNAVKTATHASAEFQGNQVGTNFLATNLNSLLTYYWRVDEVNASSDVTRGDLWYFRPRHLAFPGAEGYGRFARGGRGGVVVEVTNLNDSGPGSLRDALTGNYGPRTVVFTVSGLITLQSPLTIDANNPYITLAGQTAPGKGICVKNYVFGMSGAKDVIFRFMRIRVGKDTGLTQNASGMAGVDNCIMDHCSISWGIDEEISSRNAKNFTLQRTFISEALNIAGHDNYPAGTEHGYAASVGGEIGSLHHNLLAHNEGRNWSLAGGLDPNGYYAGSLDIFNNVVYNWGGRTTDGGAHRVNFVNNYYKPGAGSTIFVALNAQYGGFPGTQQYYFEGNVMPGHFQTSNESAGKTTSTESGGTLPENSNPPYSAWTNAPFFPSYATIDEVTNAYKKVLSDVGCNEPVIDDHDMRVIRETIDGTYTYTGTGPYGGRHGMPNTTDDVGGWEDYGNAVRPANYDTDHDGLPDWWERLKGLNTNSPAGDFSDANADLVGDEYTELDRYLNWMAAPHVDCPINGSVDVDLTALTRGYTNNSPVYAILDHTNGNATVISGTTAHFVPSVSSDSLGSFTFSVTDASGYSMTNEVGVHITAPSSPVLGLEISAGNFVLELTDESGRTNKIQSSEDLTTWSDLTNVTATGGMQLLPLNEFTNRNLFFRAVAQ